MHNVVNIFNAAELYTQRWLKCYILFYVYFTTMKKKKETALPLPIRIQFFLSEGGSRVFVKAGAALT